MGIPQKNVFGIVSSANNRIYDAAAIKQTKIKEIVLTTSRSFTKPLLTAQIN
jgi:hypothetical protein